MITRLTLSTLFVLLFFAFSAHAQEIQWELANPFRFITDQKLWNELRTTYDKLEVKSALELEKQLQLNHQELVKETRENLDELKSECRQKYKTEKSRTACIEQLQTDYSGWYSQLAVDNYAATCWNGATESFRNTGACRDYFDPESHEIKLWVNGVDVSTDDLNWLKNGTKMKIQPCGGEDSDFEIPDGADGCTSGKYLITDIEYDTAPVQISGVSKTDSSIIYNTPQPVEVVDKLIAGLGDSFASGEGNPDIPATYNDGRVETDKIAGIKRIVPKKDSSAVVWLDKSCHRSLYSYTFKTALQIALANPQQAVTYVSYACSGAETKHIINSYQNGNEPQINALKRVLCPKGKLVNGRCTTAYVRKIDYLLLSTGGNDVGFADFAANIVLSDYLMQTGLWRIAKYVLKRPVPETKEELDRTLSKNYKKLNENLTKVNDSMIKGNSAKDISSRIILTAYPNIISKEPGNKRENLCTAERKEFERPFQEDSGRNTRIFLTWEWVLKPLEKVQEDLSKSYEWTLIKEHSEEYKTHGFCAQNDIRTEDGELVPAENFAVPYQENGVWKPFAPRDYKTYETRGRWIRTPVDSKLSVNDSGMFFKAYRSIIMHPTGEGHAATAQINFEKINELTQ